MADYMKDPKYGTAEEIMALAPARLVTLLNDAAATTYAKAKACQRLAVVGDGAAAPALGRLLSDETLNHYARTALEQIPGPAASETLRNALASAKGRLLVGVINSIGVRKDPLAIRALTQLSTGPDVDAARAAEAALARIRPAL
jgi:HEAT repeat protein